MRPTARDLAASILLASTAACSVAPGDGGTSAHDGLAFVDEGKADNYYSNVASEVEVSGTLPVRMTEADYADEARRNDIVTRRLTAVGLYLTTYVTDKFRGIDSNGDGEISESEIFFRNEGYGGFHAMVRNYSVEALEVSGDATNGYQVRFEMDLAGPPDLLSRIPRAEGTSGPGLTFDLRMPKDASSDPASVNRREIRNFNPDSYTGELETVRLTAAPLPVPGNAYPHFAEMTADGMLDVTLFFGHDYNTSRSDLEEAREIFHELGDLGFTAPAQSFEELAASSGPFTRTARANGRDITVEVRIFHSDMFTTDRRAQHDLAIAELVGRDVFFYPGHAGPYYGFYLDANDAATVRYRELAEAAFTSRQQLVVAQGCQTYSQYADMLYANESKSEDNLDVITTVNYSYGRGTGQLLRSLLTFDADGDHVPVDYYRMVSDLNGEWLNSYENVFYGIMGIDGSPVLHPYASPEAIGRACTEASECGDAGGNVCVEGQCGAVALSEAGCPDGSTFRRVASGRAITGGACFAR